MDLAREQIETHASKGADGAEGLDDFPEPKDGAGHVVEAPVEHKDQQSSMRPLLSSERPHPWAVSHLTLPGIPTQELKVEVFGFIDYGPGNSRWTRAENMTSAMTT